MAEKMTLEEVRDWLRARAQDGPMQRSVFTSSSELRQMADAVNAHIAGMGEPVQAKCPTCDGTGHYMNDSGETNRCWNCQKPAPPASADVASLQSRIAEQDAEIARLTEYVRDADRRVGVQFMAAQAAAEESLRRLNACGVAHRAKRVAESRLAAADALLREVYAHVYVSPELCERIGIHLSENGHD